MKTVWISSGGSSTRTSRGARSSSAHAGTRGPGAWAARLSSRPRLAVGHPTLLTRRSPAVFSGSRTIARVDAGVRRITGHGCSRIGRSEPCRLSSDRWKKDDTVRWMRSSDRARGGRCERGEDAGVSQPWRAAQRRRSRHRCVQRRRGRRRPGRQHLARGRSRARTARASAAGCARPLLARSRRPRSR